MKVTNTVELNAALAALPEFSRKVYEAIHGGLYAEPDFSDVTVADVAKKLSCPRRAVNAAVGKLIDVGLVSSEDYESFENHQIFLHTVEHSERISR